MTTQSQSWLSNTVLQRIDLYGRCYRNNICRMSIADNQNSKTKCYTNTSSYYICCRWVYSCTDIANAVLRAAKLFIYIAAEAALQQADLQAPDLPSLVVLVDVVSVVRCRRRRRRFVIVRQVDFCAIVSISSCHKGIHIALL